MIIQCEGCASKYFLPEAKVPSKPLKVRCPQCKAVFTLMPLPQNVVAGAEESMVASPSKPAKARAKSKEAAPEPVEAKPAPEMAKPKSAPPPSEQEEARPAQPVRKRKSSKGNKAEDRAKRLARVLVSDILCYNQEKRDQALADGNLMTVLGDEIKKSWELYKEKVGPELAKSTDYFKEALNEILADGQKVF